MTEADLTEAVGLVARFYATDKRGNRRAPPSERQQIMRSLLNLGVQLSQPDPWGQRD